MRALPDIRGLKYPDEFVIRHFFRRGLHQKTGRVVELGGGTGNNLSLYAAYGWDLVDVDYSAAALADWPGTIILVSHDAPFVRDLQPDRVLLMPEGQVDHWRDDLLELVEMA